MKYDQLQSQIDFAQLSLILFASLKIRKVECISMGLD